MGESNSKNFIFIISILGISYLMLENHNTHGRKGFAVVLKFEGKRMIVVCDKSCYFMLLLTSSDTGMQTICLHVFIEQVSQAGHNLKSGVLISKFLKVCCMSLNKF